MPRLNLKQLGITKESTVDLLIERNNTKKVLCNIVKNFGINVNAEQNSLDEILEKLNNIRVDNNKGLKSTLIDCYNDVSYEKLNGDYIIIKDFIFYKYNNILKWTSLKEIQNITKYDSTFYFTSNSYELQNSHNNIIKYTQINTTKYAIYVLNDNNISKYIIQINKNNVEVLSKTELYPLFYNNSVELCNFDIAPDNNKLIIQSKNNSVGLYFLDKGEKQEVTFIKGISQSFKHNWIFLNNKEIISIVKNDKFINFMSYELNNNIAKIKSSFNCESNNENYFNSIIRYRDLNNNYKIIYHNGCYNSDKISFIIYDEEFKSYNCITNNIETQDINASKPYVFMYNDNYYIFAGMQILIFDRSWNCLSNTVNTFSFTKIYNNCIIYDNDLYSFSNNFEKVLKMKIYFDKNTTFINKIKKGENEQLIVYFANVNKDNIELF